jgi:hypothetical protein
MMPTRYLASFSHLFAESEEQSLLKRLDARLFVWCLITLISGLKNSYDAHPSLFNRLDAHLFVLMSYFVATIEERPEQQSRCPPITPCHMFRAWLNLNLLELRRGSV